ncbi:hypothetical protein C8R45DRAFT_966807 [Mycena sanguinolenta]|nr:hypothetical protein C8R45DRAFT_966807 [Mycena sanguinolenta]
MLESRCGGGGGGGAKTVRVGGAVRGAGFSAVVGVKVAALDANGEPGAETTGALEADVEARRGGRGGARKGFGCVGRDARVGGVRCWVEDDLRRGSAGGTVEVAKPDGEYACVLRTEPEEDSEDVLLVGKRDLASGEGAGVGRNGLELARGAGNGACTNARLRPTGRPSCCVCSTSLSSAKIAPPPSVGAGKRRRISSITPEPSEAYRPQSHARASRTLTVICS